MVEVQIDILSSEHKADFLKAYDGVFSSREEVKTFYVRFIENGWISGAWKERKLIGVLIWTPRESVKNGLAEIVELWVQTEERRKGIGESLLDHALLQMKWYYERFGAALMKVMLFTGAYNKYIAARNLYEKKGFRVVARIPKNALDNPCGDDLIYVLQISP